ncbi:MAG: hypothetical protein ACM3SY_10460 [Candidatus Omnitrophota bacterium]
MSMGFYFNKHHHHHHRHHLQGFTIVETTISLILTAFAVISISLFIIHGLDSSAKSHTRFVMMQELEYRKNYLLARPFASPELNAGDYSETSSPYELAWHITALTPSLKLIRVTIATRIQYQTLTKQTDFYKSKYINPVKENVYD